MNEKKLRYAWIGTLVGTFVLVVAMVLVWKFRFYDNVVSQLDQTQKNFTEQDGKAKGLDAALKAALLSRQRLELARGELDYFRTRYRSLPLSVTPTEGDGPRNASFVRYLDEYSLNFGVEASRQLIRAADESGVQINTDIKIQAPPQNPEDIVPPKSGFLKPQTEPLAVSVTGTFGTILEFFQIINRSEILMVIGNVKMEGVSPAIVATFTITPYLLVNGDAKSQSAIPGIDGALPGSAAVPAGGAGAAGAGADGLGGIPGGGDPRGSGIPGGGDPSTAPSPTGP